MLKKEWREKLKKKEGLIKVKKEEEKMDYYVNNEDIEEFKDIMKDESFDKVIKGWEEIEEIK